MKPVLVGVTGGIGAGKSLVCKIFACLGVPVYDADSRSKEIMITDQALIKQIKNEFGQSAYLSDGSLNRQYISQLVFTHQEKRSKLNSLVHPRVESDTKQWIDEHKKAPYVIKEAALLFESGVNKNVDQVIMVTAPEAVRIKRVMMRDPNRSKEQVRNIIRAQMPESEKRAKADIVIDNDETTLIVPLILKIHNQIVEQSHIFRRS